MMDEDWDKQPRQDPVIEDLIDAAAEAEEIIPLNELEAYAEAKRSGNRKYIDCESCGSKGTIQSIGYNLWQCSECKNRWSDA